VPLRCGPVPLGQTSGLAYLIENLLNPTTDPARSSAVRVFESPSFRVPRLLENSRDLQDPY
jgi:hypothetical protein